MPTMPRRSLFLVLAAAAAAALPAQSVRSVDDLPRPVEFVTAHDDSLYSLPRSQEDIHNWESALGELAAGQLQAAVERLHQLLQHETGGVVPVGGGRYYGLRQCVVLTLANLSPAASEAYEKLVRREAGNLGQRPLTELSSDQLLLLARRFPAARVGREARLRLGDLALERGAALAATAHFRQALDAAPIGSAAESSLLERLRAAQVVAEPRQFRDDDAAARDATVADVLAVMPRAADAADWPMPGGPYGSSGCMDEPVGKPVAQWTQEVAAHGLSYRGGTYSMVPVGDSEGVFVNDGIEVLAFDPLRKEVLWQSNAPLKELGNLQRTEQEYEQSYSESMVLAPALGRDVVVAALQVPENSENIDFRAGFRIISKIPERRLFGFDRRTGKQLWAHYDQLDGPVTRRFRGHCACGPAIVVGDTLYAPTHDRSNAIAFYLSAYDVHTGEVRWRRLICSSQQDVNMFGNARTEFAASPLLAAGGVIYGSTNLGICFAVDMQSGLVRWLASYEVVPVPETQLHGQRDRRVYFANNAPACLHGVVAVLPLDSEYALGLDAETGRLLWRVPFEARTNGANDVRWLLGGVGDEFVLAGAGVVAVPTRGAVDDNLVPALRPVQRPEYLRDSRFGRGETPRPALTRRYVYFPAPNRLGVFDLKGNMAPQNGDYRTQVPGNLLLVDGMLVSLRDRQLEFLYDPAALRARAEERLLQQPDDPAVILRLAVLRAALFARSPDAEARRGVEELYRRGLDAAERRGLPPDNPVRRTLADELFQFAFARARTAAQSGDADAAAQLRKAREQAPDLAAWMQVELELLQVLAGDRAAMLRELDATAAHAGSGTFAHGDSEALPVAAYVLWQKALLLPEPAAAVACWQELLERFPTVEFAGERAAELANVAIREAISAHGAGVYADIEARAAAALAAAGNDDGLLRNLCARFPHSRAAAGAQQLLLDAAVGKGSLGDVVHLLGRALADGTASAGLLRRGMVAALAGGNPPLAECLAERLLAGHGDAVSDWPDDRGQTYRQALAGGERRPPQEPPPLQVPTRVHASIRVPGYRLQPLLLGDGFPAVADQPLYVLRQEPGAREETLIAFDLQDKAPSPPELFRMSVRFPDPVLLCGRVLVVADLSTVTGIDYRTGTVLWQLPNPDNDIYSCLGVQRGVLHLAVSSGRSGGNSAFLGIEPQSGELLFARALLPGQLGRTPKGTERQLLMLQLDPDQPPQVLRIDPLTGEPERRIALSNEVLQQLGLQGDALQRAKMFPTSLCADAEHVYLPIDTTMADGPSRLGALSDLGVLDWVWTGTRGRRLLMTALFEDRLCVIESDGRSGQAVTLRASNGEVLHKADLGEAVAVLNWQRSWLPTPCPPAVMLVDREPDRDRRQPGNSARVTCFGVADGVPTFAQPLAPQDEMPVQSPVLGPDFLCFGLRPAGRGAFRLCVLRLQDRRGALPDGNKYLGLPGNGPYMLGTAGPYTVLAANEQLTILGDEDHK